MGNGDPKKSESITDMYLHAGGVLGELVYGAKETFLTPLEGALHDILLVPDAPAPAPPPPPPKKPLPQADLEFKLHVMPFPVGYAGDSVTVLAEVNYKGTGTDGKPGKWPYPEKWVEVLFQRQVHKGPGPFTMDLPDVETYAVVLRAVVGNGKTVQLEKVNVQSVCGARLPTDAAHKLLTCTLFSEGGSRSSPPLSDPEMFAIAWSIKNRFEALAKAKHTNSARKWSYFAGRWYKESTRNVPYPFSHSLSYSDLVRGYKQYTGVGGKQFNICADPIKNIESIGACRRVQKCAEVVDAVFVRGTVPDPYQGKGNPNYPGVFYYKVKGNTPPHKGPLLPDLTGNDHHFHQGLDEDYVP